MLHVRSAIPSGLRGTVHATIGGMLPAVLLLLTNTLAADPTIEATRRDDGTYQFTLTSQEPIGVAEAQAAILIQARQLCGNHMPELGIYNFSKSEVVKRPVDADGSDDDDELVLVQDISCNPSPPTRDRKRTRSLTAEDKQLIESRVRSLTESYLHMPTNGEYRRPYSMLTDFMKSILPFETWQKQQEDFVADSGPVQETDIWRITIYVDSPSAPEPGIYVAADYEMSFENVPFKCGYIVWVEQPDRTFLITREETGELDASTLAGIDKSDIPSVKRRIGCRD